MKCRFREFEKSHSGIGTIWSSYRAARSQSETGLKPKSLLKRTECSWRLEGAVRTTPKSGYYSKQ